MDQQQEEANAAKEIQRNFQKYLPLMKSFAEFVENRPGGVRIKSQLRLLFLMLTQENPLLARMEEMRIIIENLLKQITELEAMRIYERPIEVKTENFEGADKFDSTIAILCDPIEFEGENSTIGASSDQIEIDINNSTNAVSSVPIEIDTENSTIAIQSDLIESEIEGPSNAVQTDQTSTGNSTSGRQSTSIAIDNSNTTIAASFDPIEIGNECSDEEVIETLRRHLFDENGRLTSRGQSVCNVMNKYLANK